MLSKFQIDLVYCTGAMAKINFCPMKIQHQQLKGENLNMEASSYSVDPTRGYLHKKTAMNQQPSHHATTETSACSKRKATAPHSNHSNSRYVTETRSSIA